MGLDDVFGRSFGKPRKRWRISAAERSLIADLHDRASFLAVCQLSPGATPDPEIVADVKATLECTGLGEDLARLHVPQEPIVTVLARAVIAARADRAAAYARKAVGFRPGVQRKRGRPRKLGEGFGVWECARLIAESTGRRELGLVGALVYATGVLDGIPCPLARRYDGSPEVVPDGAKWRLAGWCDRSTARRRCTKAPVRCDKARARARDIWRSLRADLGGGDKMR
jgi:hypothetical protein